MPDLLAKGAAWLAGQFRSYVSSEVYYLRGAASVKVRSTRGQSSFDVTDSNGILSRVDTHDFLIHASDLLIDGLPEEPKTGDRIVTGDLDSDGQVYEVASIPGADVWRWADEFRIRYRVHTKYVGPHPA